MAVNGASVQICPEIIELSSDDSDCEKSQIPKEDSLENGDIQPKGFLSICNQRSITCNPSPLLVSYLEQSKNKVIKDKNIVQINSASPVKEDETVNKLSITVTAEGSSKSNEQEKNLEQTTSTLPVKEEKTVNKPSLTITAIESSKPTKEVTPAVEEVNEKDNCKPKRRLNFSSLDLGNSSKKRKTEINSDVEADQRLLEQTSASSSSVKDVFSPDESEIAIKELIVLCKQYTKDKEEDAIVERIHNLYERASKSFTNSPEFCHLISVHFNKIREDPDNLFVHVREVCNHLKAWREKKPKEKHKTPREILRNQPPSLSNSVENSSDGSSSNTNTLQKPNKKLPSDKHIRKLEKLLGAISRKIQILKEKELDFDEMDDADSTYLLEDRYIKRFNKVWDKLCEYKGRSSLTGRVVERKFHYEGSRFPEINKKIQKYVNKTREFPDYSDILTLIQRVNVKHNLHLMPRQMEGQAASIFREVGNILQSRRIQDFMELYDYYLADEKDPAISDQELEEQLSKPEDFQKSLEVEYEKFTQQQLRIGDATASEDEEEDEDSSLKRRKLSGSSKSSESSKPTPHKDKAPPDSSDEDDKENDSDASSVGSDFHQLSEEFKIEVEEDSLQEAACQSPTKSLHQNRIAITSDESDSQDSPVTPDSSDAEDSVKPSKEEDLNRNVEEYFDNSSSPSLLQNFQPVVNEQEHSKISMNSENLCKPGPSGLQKIMLNFSSVHEATNCLKGNTKTPTFVADDDDDCIILE